MSDKLAIKVTKAAHSKLPNVDFENLPFGKTFSDHMLIGTYADGAWKDFEIVPFGDISLSPAISALHYGQTFFEGLKAYRHDDGKISVFRPDKNAKRFNISAERMCMPTLPEEMFIESIAKLVDIDRDWVPSKEGYTMYIRPFMFATDPYLGVAPSTTYKFMVLVCPTGAYFSKNLNVKIETEYTRSAEGGFGYAKAAGNYAGSLFPGKKASEKGFDQILWTDAKTHEYVEEMGAANAMFVINGKLVTPSTRDTILDGVTRDSIITLAKSWGMEVEERRVAVAEVLEAIENGTCTDAFGAGTAATIASVAEMYHNGKTYVLPDPSKSEFANKMRKALDDIKYGRVEDTRGWNYMI
ncbi:branched-chain amino acid aminotransferase [Pelobium manganitolerans]|uniref:branched-chain-amino-acid transaminase n=1 Tax=Pelobium manganitolerans TaxID=1842495 RepID=A0A419SC12_9SPHI|nr:branched-chain amino acid aminotransferase [Pelobium manganitolerans]RKD20186.1 branched-chain amino acid aminotransferase [Pelobium manganitolerans]